MRNELIITPDGKYGVAGHSDLNHQIVKFLDNRVVEIDKKKLSISNYSKNQVNLLTVSRMDGFSMIVIRENSLRIIYLHVKSVKDGKITLTNGKAPFDVNRTDPAVDLVRSKDRTAIRAFIR